MSYYLQTLEGVPRLGSVSDERKKQVVENFNFLVTRDPDITAITDETRRFYNSFLRLESAFTVEEIATLWEGKKLNDSASQAVELYENQKAAERERDERDAKRRADIERKASEAEAARIAALQQQAQEEAEAEREALDEQRRLAAQQASAVEEAEEIINEGNSMAQNIPAQEETDVNISTQLVTSGSEFTVVDETPETIAYVDEAGELHVEQKQKSGLGWLVAAAAAFFILT